MDLQLANMNYGPEWAQPQELDAMHIQVTWKAMDYYLPCSFSKIPPSDQLSPTHTHLTHWRLLWQSQINPFWNLHANQHDTKPIAHHFQWLWPHQWNLSNNSMHPSQDSPSPCQRASRQQYTKRRSTLPHPVAHRMHQMQWMSLPSPQKLTNQCSTSSLPSLHIPTVTKMESSNHLTTTQIHERGSQITWLLHLSDN